MKLPKAHVDGIKRYIINDIDRSGFLRLDKNEFSVPFPDDILEDFRNCLTSYTLQAYPSTFEVNRQIAALVDHPCTEQILATPGSDYSLKACYDAFIKDGDEIGLPEPTYAMNDVYARAGGGRLVSFRYDDDLHLPYDDIEAALPRLRMIVIANPNQPTGRLEEATRFRQLLSDCRKHGVWAVVDEAYYSFSRFTVADLVDELDNLIVVRSFSKSYGLAGLRIGALIAQPQVVAYINKVMPVYCVNAVALAFLRVLTKHRSYFTHAVSEQRAGLKMVAELFKSLGCHCYESQTNFVMVESNPVVEASSFSSFLKERGILIRGPFTRHPFTNAFRISGTDPGGFATLKKATYQFLEHHQPAAGPSTTTGASGVERPSP